MELVRGQKVSEDVKRTLVFHHTLIKEIKEKYSLSKNRESIVNMVSSKLLKKYRLKKYAAQELGISRKRVNQKKVKILNRKGSQLIFEIKKNVKTFLQRDDNSRASAGKKETITRHKIKKQKRFLNDDLKHLHVKFLSENPRTKLSYSMFCRLRPFWVMKATEKDRETCLCIKHENLQYKAEKLKDLGVIQTSNLGELAEDVCCDTNDKACMYRECHTCLDKMVSVNENNLGQQTVWKKWATRRVEKTKKVQGEDVKYVASVTLREEESGSVASLVSDFQQDLKKTCKHLYNIKHQYASLKHLRENIEENEVIIHIDFSENYQCKYDREIQSVHFGASQNQVTLHTGVFYYKDNCSGFCTLSDDGKHGPPAIWAHLKPILLLIKEKHPAVDIIYVISDGPTTQYRCKANFFLLSVLPFEMGFQAVNWSFLEAGHGKGPADGIGGSVKRSADAYVSKGHSITNAKTMNDALECGGSNISFFLINPIEIEEMSQLIPPDLNAIAKTMTLHQVYSNKRRTLSARVLSCFCEKPNICNCFQPTIHVFASQTSEPDATCPAEQAASAGLIGKWCIVSYDNVSYPGIVQDVDDDDIEVKVMHKVGRNRYFWPLIPDIIWYTHSKLVCIIDERTLIGSRHYQISKGDWEKVENVMNL